MNYFVACIHNILARERVLLAAATDTHLQTNMTIKRGRNFLLTPGPTNVPERVLQAMARNAVDISGTDFIDFSRTCIDALKPIFKTQGEVFLYIANGHGAWEAALANTLQAGDHILVPGTGHFAENWADMGQALGAIADIIASDWRSAVDPEQIEQRLRADHQQRIKAVLLVHTDTASGVSNDVIAVRKAIDSAQHPALLMVDTVASLGTTDFRMDEWGVDVAVSASQKGLMAPPGLSFTAANERALQLSQQLSVSNYWSWQRRLQDEWYRWFCGTAPEHLLFGLRTAIDMLMEEGLDSAFARHQRLADAVRAAIQTWAQAGVVGLNALDPTTAANSTTTIRLTDGFDASQVKALCLQHFNVSLGGGLGQLYGKAFRISHMGDMNEPTVLGGLASVEATLQLCDIPHGSGGVTAAIDSLTIALNKT